MTEKLGAPPDITLLLCRRNARNSTEPNTSCSAGASTTGSRAVPSVLTTTSSIIIATIGTGLSAYVSASFHQIARVGAWVLSAGTNITGRPTSAVRVALVARESHYPEGRVRRLAKPPQRPGRFNDLVGLRLGRLAERMFCRIVAEAVRQEKTASMGPLPQYGHKVSVN
jgi:hypothetical protein